MSKNQNSLKQLNEIIALLQGNAETITAETVSITNRSDEQDFWEDEESQPLFKASVIPVYSGLDIKLLPEVQSGLYDPINNLSIYLNENKTNYQASYLTNVSQKTNDMVIAINRFLVDENQKKKSESNENDELRRKAIAAIKDFHGAFSFNQTKDIVLKELLGAILGAAFGLVTPFGILPAAVLGAGIMGTALLLRRLYLGDIAKLETMSNEIRNAANRLIMPEPEEVFFEIQKSWFDYFRKTTYTQIKPETVSHDELCRQNADDIEAQPTGTTQKKSP